MSAIASIDPRSGDAIEDVAQPTTPADADAACAEAQAASAALERTTPAERAALLRDMAVALEEERERLVALADRESALGTGRLDGELTRTCTQLRHFADVLEDGHCFEATIDRPGPGRPDLRRVMRAIGPAVVFGASNFPFAFSAAGGDTASALAAGCAVIVKAHGSHPRLDAEVVHILQGVCNAAGLPAATVSVVFGREAGTKAVAHPAVKAVGFTGSEAAGRHLMDVAAQRPDPIPVYAEMGSANPLVVSPRAVQTRPLELAAGIAQSGTLGHGQFCTKPGLVFVPAGASGDALVTELRREYSAKASAPMLSRSIRDSYQEGVEAVHRHPAAQTLVPLRVETGTGSSSWAALAETQADDLIASPELGAETFGPASVVVRYQTTSDLASALGAVAPSLTVSVHAEPDEPDFALMVQSLAEQRAGRVLYNEFPTGVAVTWAQNHGGPYPAASTSMHTSVGGTAIRRFLRPVAYQGWPNELLPPSLQDGNPWGLPRRVDGRLQEPVAGRA